MQLIIDKNPETKHTPQRNQKNPKKQNANPQKTRELIAPERFKL